MLKDGGLVVSRAEGTRRVYRLNPEGVAALRAWLDGVWDEALTVELEHRHLDRLVGGQALRDGITGGGGWGAILELFAKAAVGED